MLRQQPLHLSLLQSGERSREGPRVEGAGLRGSTSEIAPGSRPGCLSRQAAPVSSAPPPPTPPTHTHAHAPYTHLLHLGVFCEGQVHKGHVKALCHVLQVSVVGNDERDLVCLCVRGWGGGGGVQQQKQQPEGECTHGGLCMGLV